MTDAHVEIIRLLDDRLHSLGWTRDEVADYLNRLSYRVMEMTGTAAQNLVILFKKDSDYVSTFLTAFTERTKNGSNDYAGFNYACMSAAGRSIAAFAYNKPVLRLIDGTQSRVSLQERQPE